MAKCIIILPLYEGEFPELIRREDGDLVLCADAGFDRARELGLHDDMVVGDFDSLGRLPEADCPVKQLPVHKDDTDTAVCMEEGRKRGYRRFVLAGGIGGRLDHTLANLHLLADSALRGEDAGLTGRDNLVRALASGQHDVKRREGFKLSFFAYTERVTGLTLSGVAYPLHDAVLTQRIPLGVSNEWTEETARVSFAEGVLLVVQSRDAEAARK